LEDHYSKYRMSDALMTTYKLIWDDFCSWFLEMIKPPYGEKIDGTTFKSAVSILENNLKVLHPFVPFISEEIWQNISERSTDEALIISKWPEQYDVNASIIEDFNKVTEVISGIRTIRKEKNISFKDTIEVKVINTEKLSDKYNSIIAKMGNLSSIETVNESVDGALSFRVKSNEYFIPMAGEIDVDAEIEKLKAELDYTEGFLKSVKKKLSNERFVNNAPEQVVAVEKKKQSEAEAKIETIKASLASLQ